jgi:hypothetical protein
VTTAVVAGALFAALLNALPSALGAWLWFRGADPKRSFWLLVRIGQAAAVALALGIGVLAAAGRYSSYHLFYLYALLPLAVGFVAEQLRVASAQAVLDQRGLPDAQAVGRLPAPEQLAIVSTILRREMGVMTLAAAVVVFLTLRAASTAHGF